MRSSLEHGTAMLPHLLCERVNEMALDFAIGYPEHALFFQAGSAARTATCRRPRLQRDGGQRFSRRRSDPAAKVTRKVFRQRSAKIVIFRTTGIAKGYFGTIEASNRPLNRVP